MGEQKEGKLNRLLVQLGDTDLASSRWLRTHGYASSLVSRYVGSGWLVSPSRGVYLRNGGRLEWSGVVRTLQEREQLSLHVGGRFALAWEGYEHYLRLGQAPAITLYGAAPPPGWVTQLPLAETFSFCGLGPFAPPPFLYPDATDQMLMEHGLMWRTDETGVSALVTSTPERAILELCQQASSAALVYEIDALLQGMSTLRPGRLGALLRRCNSIKAKRLFLALAERHAHAWWPHLSLAGVDTGSGKRSLVAGGQLHPLYQITLPRDLDAHLG